MWELLAEEIARDCAAVVMMIDNTRNYPLRDLKYYAREFANIIRGRKLIVAITRGDLRSEPSAATYESLLQELQLDAHVLFVDGRRRSQLLTIIETALDDDTALEQLRMLRSEALVAEGESDVVTSASEDAAEPVADYTGEQVEIKPEVVETLMEMEGVTGLAAMDEHGDILLSKLEDEKLENLISLGASVSHSLGESQSLGQVTSMVFRDRSTDNLSVFVWEGRALGVTSTRRTSIRMVRQQVNDLMQWG
jgi:hypothetical protein